MLRWKMQIAAHEENADRSVVITGAAGGIGSALVRRFLTRGARVYAADRDQEALGRLQMGFGSSSRLCTAVLDVSDESQCLDFAARIRAEWNGVDVLVNAAGWFPLTPFEEVTYAQWREIIAVNLDGPFLVTRSLLSLLKASRTGRIILFSSASIHHAATKISRVRPPRSGRRSCPGRWTRSPGSSEGFRTANPLF